MRHVIFFILFMATVVPTVKAQLSVKEILSSYRKEKAFIRQQEKMKYIGNHTYDLPWIDGLEIRTSTNDFNLREQEFTARITPNSKAERESQKAYQQSYIKAHQADEQILASEFLEERYRLVVDAYFLETLIRLKTIYSRVYSDRMKVLKKSVNLSGFNINDLIKADDALKEMQREIVELEEALKFSRGVLSDWTRTKNKLHIVDSFIDISDLMEVARKLRVDPMTHIKLLKWTLNVDQARRKLELSTAENKKVIDFFQARYGTSSKPNFRSDFSLGMGFTIPLKKSQQIKTSELKVEKMVNENSYANIREELTESMEHILTQMETQYRIYQLVEEQISNSQANFVFQQYKSIGGAPALTLLQLKESDLKKELELFKVEQNIYNLYIELLVVSGRISTMPLKNYLSNEQERF